ncbi:MAG TPA: response regulator transcription factor [Streptosporangiaceae bacterium]|nr:response regulator transcription factor [Streptosporangiaceae bacterium]
MDEERTEAQPLAASVGASGGLARVLIIGVPSLLIEGLQTVLERDQDFAVLGVESSGSQAVRLVRQLAPDFLIIALDLVDVPVLDLVEQLSSADKELISKILVFGNFREPATIMRLLKAGICGFLEDDITSQTLMVKLRQFTQGQPVLGRSTMCALIGWCEQKKADESDHSAELAKLSPQERRVLELMAEGLPTAAIASTLRLSETTVRSHVHRMKLKLGMPSRDKLIAFAVRCAERRHALEG